MIDRSMVVALSFAWLSQLKGEEKCEWWGGKGWKGEKGRKGLTRGWEGKENRKEGGKEGRK